jgi:hypothetical protein
MVKNTRKEKPLLPASLNEETDLCHRISKSQAELRGRDPQNTSYHFLERQTPEEEEEEVEEARRSPASFQYSTSRTLIKEQALVENRKMATAPSVTFIRISGTQIGNKVKAGRKTRRETGRETAVALCRWTSGAHERMRGMLQTDDWAVAVPKR